MRLIIIFLFLGFLVTLLCLWWGTYAVELKHWWKSLWLFKKSDYSLQKQFKRIKSSPWVEQLLEKDFVLSADVVDKVVNGEPVSAHSCLYDPQQGCSAKKIAKIRPHKLDKRYRYGHKVLFKERIWGVKIADQILYNLEDYSISGAAKLALQFPFAEIYSDTVIKYYQNGSREIINAQVYILYNVPSPYKGWKFFSPLKAKALFPKLFTENLSAYQNCDILFSPDFSKVCVHSAWKNDKGGTVLFSSFSDLIENPSKLQVLNSDNLSGSKFVPKVVGGTFKSFWADVLNNRGVHECCFALFAHDVVYGDRYKNFYIGYAELPYEDALKFATDKEQIYQAYVKNAEVTSFNLLQDGSYFNSDNDVCLLPLSFYAEFAKPFTMSELRKIFRCRIFKTGKISWDCALE